MLVQLSQTWENDMAILGMTFNVCGILVQKWVFEVDNSLILYKLIVSIATFVAERNSPYSLQSEMIRFHHYLSYGEWKQEEPPVLFTFSITSTTYQDVWQGVWRKESSRSSEEGEWEVRRREQEEGQRNSRFAEED